MKVKAPPIRVKRVCRCLNPQCTVQVAGGKMPLRSRWIKEYDRMRCEKCGAISVFNPIGRVDGHLLHHIYVMRDGGKAVEHIFPTNRVLVA